MRMTDIKIGGLYLTKVSGLLVKVQVIRGEDGRWVCERFGTALPKPRTTQALRPIVIRYGYKGRLHAVPIVSACPKCGAWAITPLPPEILAEQTDGTTHVCHTLACGCNHGFAQEAKSAEVSK